MTTLPTITSRFASSSARDLVGIGIGPFNLSLAALLDGLPELDVAFYDRKPDFVWHGGLMFPGSILQTSFLKDLVTPIQPTSPHSFVNYLVEHKRFYDFMAGRFVGVSRTEFSAYMAWVARRLTSTHWNHAAREVTYKDGHFEVTFDKSSVQARNIAVATGMEPNIPDWAMHHMGDTCFHAGTYLYQTTPMQGRRVTVIGGGQTGAEIVLNLLTDPDRRPEQVTWISNLARFSPLEEGGFVDQVFTPGYVGAYQSMSSAARRSEVAGQKLASDGLTPATIDALYEEIYRRKHLAGNPDSVTLLPGRNVTGLHRDHRGYQIHCETTATDQSETHAADIVVLAVGARPKLPEFMAPLRDRIDCDESGMPKLSPSYELAFDGPKDRKIFGLNMGLASHGIVDPQMSLMAWRAGIIINALLGREIFNTSPGEEFVTWQRGCEPVAAAAPQAAAAS
ncbi:lysine N(6)-hydroxylase/L-ornithine N(5)-oxygenase family protein [Roseibium sp.]|uniref:lysine N(6)-hydroxylase/L-ornithine N(5)-oxygenase family protein n=1 Tax=Roseibium sp. TaxID=1936156 RepID=UPI003A9847F3